MKSEYYLSTTYWVIFVAIIVAIATVWLYRTGKATVKTQLIVALLFQLVQSLRVFGGGPIFLWLHFVSIMKLRQNQRSSNKCNRNIKSVIINRQYVREFQGGES